VSIEVFADSKTRSDEILRESRKLFAWIPNAYIKIPITKEGLIAAKQAVREGIKINMTLCFNQEQAAAVYSATKGAQKRQVFISPFIGRLDDVKKNGLNLVSNILRMYKNGDGHVSVIAASIRDLSHLTRCLGFGFDIVTVPYQILEEWADSKFTVLAKTHRCKTSLKRIPYNKRITIGLKEWEKMQLQDELTDQGIKKFCRDWKALVA
jgi:transaldolase